MKKAISTFVLFCLAFICMKAQYKESEALFSTGLTYEIPDSKGYPFTAEQFLCKSEVGYYLATKYSLAEDRSEENYLVFYLGDNEDVISNVNSLSQLIANSSLGFTTEIKDAKGVEFIIFAPEDRIGTYLILQKKGEEDWGIISKQHLKNTLRML